MWSTGINKCVEPTAHVRYIQYVICTFDAHEKSFKCKAPRKISIEVCLVPDFISDTLKLDK